MSRSTPKSPKWSGSADFRANGGLLECIGDGARIWQRSFKNQAESLAAWFETWLTRPAAADLASQAADDAGFKHLRTTLPVLRAMTVEGRAAVGITGDDWEESFCRRPGVDPAYL